METWSHARRKGKQIPNGMSRILVFGILLAILGACRNQPAPETPNAGPLPNTPEAVVRQYQAFLDSNLFDQARLLSTPRAADFLEMLAQMISDEPMDSSVVHTSFLKIDCTERGDTAVCICLAQDEFEEYETEFRLLRMAGQWLVDLPEEGEIEGAEEMMPDTWPEQDGGSGQEREN